MTRMKWLIAAIIGVLVVVGGAGTAYASYYSDKALPTASVGGHNVNAMNRDELVAWINDQASQVSIDIDVDGTPSKASLADLGVTVDAQASADQVLASSDSVWERFVGLFKRSDYPLVSSTDKKTFNAYMASLVKSVGEAPKSATVSVDEQGAFVVTPGVPGIAIDAQPLNDAVATALQTLSSQAISVSPSTQDPIVSDKQAQKVADAATALVAHSVTISDGIKDYTAETVDRAAWVALPGVDDVEGTPSIDPEAVQAWVDKTAEATNVAPTPAINNVDGAGNVLAESMPGKEGEAVNNSAQVGADVVAALNAGTDYSGSFDYDKVPPPTETRPVMAGYEAYPYAMHEGEKWIDINLTTNRLTAYEGQTVVHDPIAVNHGAPGHETVTGTYHIYLKYEKQDMGCTPEWPHCAKDVPWVSYFTGSYAIHGAPWVRQFGLGSVGGSHGCVNLPVAEAHYVFSWADSGTAVVTHY